MFFLQQERPISKEKFKHGHNLNVTEERVDVHINTGNHQVLAWMYLPYPSFLSLHWFLALFESMWGRLSKLKIMATA